MRMWLYNLALSFLFAAFATNIVSHAQGFDGDIDFIQLQKASKSASEQTQYQAAMQVLREQMRAKLLPNLWKATQENSEIRVGAMSLSELFEKLDHFNLFQNDTDLVLQADEERKSDFYVLNENWGAINTEQMQSLLKTKAGLVLPLHIFLGASGYQDENYQLSLVLVLLDRSMSAKSDLNEIDIPKLFPQDKRKLYRLEPHAINSGQLGDKQKLLKTSKGGFTGVGGGGDGRSLQVKIELITNYLFAFSGLSLSSEACFRKWADPLTFLQDVLEVEVESSTQIKEVQLNHFKDTWGILIPSYDPLDEKRLKSIVQSSVATLCLVQELRK